MSNIAIPTLSREQVRSRDGGRCVRCGGSRAVQWHHRRSRRVVDGHRHCPCNGVLLCDECHRWVHRHPSDSRDLGLIVSVHEREPSLIPVFTYSGWFFNDCAGGYTRYAFTTSDGGAQ